jgi:glycosidase
MHRLRSKPKHLVLLAALMLAVLPSTIAQSSAPTIARIDPPNWFAAMPDPMLLVQGTNLGSARFTASNKDVRVTRTTTSPNGHWAIVSLDTHAARPGSLHLIASTAAGSVSVDYLLKPRRPASEVATGLSPKDVLYLIMPDRFADGDPHNNEPKGSEGTYNRSIAHAYHGGDLRGIINHLDYLQQLGVTALWLTPILANDPKGTDYHGYGATDMYAVDPRLGTLAEYRELSDALHKRHMKLVFDDVPNHVGPNILWATDPPLPDWFHGTAAQHLDNKYLFHPTTDPHAAPGADHEALDGWFVNLLPDMNQQNPVVAQYETQNMIWWIEEGGIDGLRIDTFPYVQREFWQSYLGTLKSIYPNLTSVGEVSDGDPTVNAFYAGGRTIDGVDTHLETPFDYPLYYTLLDVLVKGKPMSALENTLRQDWLYPHPEVLVPFIGNHDQIRFMSLPNATPALLRLGYGLLLTLRGMPELYAGDEIAMQGGDDPDNRRDFPGGFPGDPADAFTPAGRTAGQAAIHDWVAALGSFRAHTPALQTGRQQTVLATDTAFAYVRIAPGSATACGHPSQSVLVAINRDPAAQSLTIPVNGTTLSGCTNLQATLGDAPKDSSISVQPSSIRIDLPPYGFAVYALR